MSTNAKVLRGQLRQVVQEMLPDLLKEALYKEIDRKVNDRLEAITKHLKSTLDTIDERHKDTMSYLIRNATKVESTERK